MVCKITECVHYGNCNECICNEKCNSCIHHDKCNDWCEDFGVQLKGSGCPFFNDANAVLDINKVKKAKEEIISLMEEYETEWLSYSESTIDNPHAKAEAMRIAIKIVNDKLLNESDKEK